MFKLKQDEVKLTGCVLRPENHGDEYKSAATLKLTAELKAHALNDIEPGLMEAFYDFRKKQEEDTKQQELIENATPDMFTELKFAYLEPFKSIVEFEGCRVVVHQQVDEDSVHFILADCKVKKFKIACKKGGWVDVSFNVNCYPQPSDVGWLFDHLMDDISMSIEPPAQLEMEEMEETVEALNENLSTIGSSDTQSENGVDFLFGDALAFCRAKDGSIMSIDLRDQFEIGDARANLILDQLETAGWVSAADDNGQRTFIEQDDQAA